MRSVPRAVATGSNQRDGQDRRNLNPVATARGTDLIAILARKRKIRAKLESRARILLFPYLE
jgi:hypothetical protein